MTFQPPPPPPPQGQPPQGPPPQGPPPQGPPPQGPPPQGPPPAAYPQGSYPPPAYPQGSYPQGPPPSGGPGSQWGPPPGQPARPGGSFDPKTVDPMDWGILGAGLLAFIFSFVSYYTYSFRSVDLGSLNAWHGFFGWFAMLLAVIGSAVVALEIFMPHVKLPFPNRLIGFAAYALATLCVLLALFVTPGLDLGDGGVDEGHGVGYWISLIVIVAGLVLSFLRFQATGGKLPIGGGGGNKGLGGTGGQRPGAGGPPPGYGPPQGPPPGPPQGPPPGYGPPPGGPPVR